MLNKCIIKNQISMLLGGNEIKKTCFPRLSRTISVPISGRDVGHCGSWVYLNVLVSSFVFLCIMTLPPYLHFKRVTSATCAQLMLKPSVGRPNAAPHRRPSCKPLSFVKDSVYQQGKHDIKSSTCFRNAIL